MNQDTQTHCNSVARKGKHITFSERQQIERWLREKKSISQIAKLLDRHRVTIYREVKRGSVSQLKHDLTVYRTYRVDCKIKCDRFLAQKRGAKRFKAC